MTNEHHIVDVDIKTNSFGQLHSGSYTAGNLIKAALTWNRSLSKANHVLK